jgi:hypothetical protein
MMKVRSVLSEYYDDEAAMSAALLGELDEMFSECNIGG